MTTNHEKLSTFDRVFEGGLLASILAGITVVLFPTSPLAIRTFTVIGGVFIVVCGLWATFYFGKRVITGNR